MGCEPTNNLDLIAPDCNGESGFQCAEPPAPTQKASLTTCENHKAQTSLSLDLFLRHLSVPACSSLKVRSGGQLAYPAGKGSAAMLPTTINTTAAIPGHLPRRFLRLMAYTSDS